MNSNSTYLVFGATGQTGQHFLSLALAQGNKVRALARSPDRVLLADANLEVIKGSVADESTLDELVVGVQFVVVMLGDAKQQSVQKVNTPFMKRLIPAMRRQGVKRVLYQAGGLTARYKERLPLVPWLLRQTIARYSGLIGQHEDNEATLAYLVEEAQDIDWIVHRAGITSNGPSKGTLIRSQSKIGLATFGDCAAYNYRIISDESAIHTYDLSCYER